MKKSPRLISPFAGVVVVALLCCCSARAEDDVHPIEQLARAKARAEIALRTNRKVLENELNVISEKWQLCRRSADEVRKTLHGTRAVEQRKPEFERDQAVLDECNRLLEIYERDKWPATEAALRSLDQKCRKIQERSRMLWDAAGKLDGLADKWTDLGLDLLSIIPLFNVIEEETRMLEVEAKETLAAVDAKCEEWAAAVEKVAELAAGEGSE
jgi:hypothetical protein